MRLCAFFKIDDNAVAQDLIQDTFLKTWTYLVRGGKIDLMRPFLYHILNQLIIDEYRKRKTSSLDSLIEKGFEPGFDDSGSILDILDGRAMIPLIQNLPAKYEKVIRMKYVEDLSIKEIALVTGQTKNTVTVQIHRGIAKFKKLYNHN